MRTNRGASLVSVVKQRKDAESKIRFLQSRIKHNELLAARTEQKAVKTKSHTETVLKQRRDALSRLRAKESAKNIAKQSLEEAKAQHAMFRTQCKSRIEKSRNEKLREKSDTARSTQRELKELRTTRNSCTPAKQRYVHTIKHTVNVDSDRTNQKRVEEFGKIEAIRKQICQLESIEKSLTLSLIHI